ncbi:fibronectin-binding domain-containing protein [Thermoplasma sp. Kam2015]|uniref:ribosome rescue protein RqcH n=1 Tax=Thermoplasma sp. Kam2015 TaxID=2094122 RepID=UPI000D88A885|nr:ribosome rescue protein RqcH [Thermoplasma sp. Kam2015]PYB67601.1 fibronectin-binding domain-containing protein [Thermoplasma sp. Kam2015]
MKDKESSIDFYAFVNIYRDRFIGSFVKKVYQIGPDDFLVQVYRSDIKRMDVLISLKHGIFFRTAETPETATQTAMVLRKSISDRRIVEIRQINFDRVVEFTFHTGQKLILELFREGNLIATDGDKITFVLRPRKWKNRDLEVGSTYLPPSSFDPSTASADDISRVISASSANIVQTLATRLNLGGELAEEILYRAGIDKETPARSASERSGDIRGMLDTLLKESLGNRSYYYEDQALVSPCEMRHFGSPSRIFEDLNEGLVFALENSKGEEELEDPITRRINSQKKSIEEFERLSNEKQEIGKAIMARLQEIDSAIRSARSGNYAGTIDKARKLITVDLDGRQVDIDYTVSAGENASRYFSQAKEYRKKIEGAMKAIEEAEKQRLIEMQKADKKKRRRVFWFETYHWFISSEGYLVIAGRDAKSNEKIVKKHLQEGDIYVHADMYGAPSTIIKSSGKDPPGDATIREAGAFAVSFSRAWAAGIASGTAYWVYPSQVSKTPESGEYVSTGSWIIRGKRNYITDLKLELCIGMRDVEGIQIPMIGPQSVFASGEKCVKIVPGDHKRSEIARRIAEMLSTDKEEIEKILPPGGSTIVE